MTDDKKRRKSADLGAAPLSRKAKIYMDLAAQRVAAADLQSVGSQAGVSLAQEAIGYTAFAVSHHLEHLYSAGATEREGWLSVLRFLSGTLLFQHRLESLTLALTELDRGLVSDGLKTSASAQGGIPTARKLKWMTAAVEIVDEIIRQHGGRKTKALAFIEDEAGVSASTIRNWRKTLAKAAPEHHPRTFRRWMQLGGAIEENEPDDDKRIRLAPLVASLRSMDEAAKKNK